MTIEAKVKINTLPAGTTFLTSDGKFGMVLNLASAGITPALNTTAWVNLTTGDLVQSDNASTEVTAILLKAVRV